ncbi:hypothetical protein L0337_41355 [candidate division KSB1 bacterium]|nr:hypothetical protein [candidate division KSB1 bacterium]
MRTVLVVFMLVLLCLFVLVSSPLPAQDRCKKANEVRLSKVFGIDWPFWAPNRIGDYLTNIGQLVSHIPANSAGMEWPVGSGHAINFASGIWLLGKKDGEIVSAVAEYSTEFQPGNVTGWSPGVAGTPADPQDSRFKIYIINRQDVANPTANPDYINWPVADGAPVDAQGKPLLLGTSTAWAVFNDYDPDLHDRLFKSQPIGVEVQMTAWAFDRVDAYGDIMFFKFKLINKSGKNLTDAYIAFWADIDIGDARDLVGCDTTLSLGFAYKTKPDELYGVNPPAIGYDLLQGPIVPSPGDTARVSGKKIPDFKNLPMTTFYKFT